MKQRKNKVNLIVVAVLIIILCCAGVCGCKKTYTWEINGTLDDINKIEIIYYEEDDFYIDRFQVICEINEDDYLEIIEDIRKLEYKKYFASPKHPKEETIRITFKNGNFDVISIVEPRHCFYNQGVGESKITWLSASKKEEQFNQLIQKWINK
ncbi:MAG: hypothetical protein HFJ81_00745 [Clostridia bacterium]|nr:hypothetical protein [Clostridia bacterium]